MARKPSTNSKPAAQAPQQSGDAAGKAADASSAPGTGEVPAASATAGEASAPAGPAVPPVSEATEAKQPEGEPAARPVAEAETAVTQAIPLDMLREMAREGACVIVKGPMGGRWRAGRHFGPTETPVPLAELSDEEIAAIIADPFLSHSLAQIEEPEAK